MGMDKGGAKLLLQEALQRPFTGRVLTLGKQDINLTFATLQKAAQELGAQLHDPGEIILSDVPEFASRGCISDQTFFKALGFSEVAAMDYSDFESARYIHDLNRSEPPNHLLESFDVIIDGGTIEHVFHIPNALNNTHRMLSPHGRIIHMSPSSNHMDHGFYMFSPTLFWDFYQTNRYEINTFQVFRYTQRPSIDPWEISEYKPGCLHAVSFGGLDDAMYGIFCVATKTVASTGHKIPQQGLYLKVWGLTTEEETKAEPTEEASIHTAASKFQPIKKLIKRIPGALGVLKYIRQLTRATQKETRTPQEEMPPKKGLGLKIIARY